MTIQSLSFEDALRMAAESLAAGDLHTADQVLQAARDAAPNDPRVWTGIAAVQFRAGDADAAIAALNKAIELVPGEWSYRRELIRVLTAIGDDSAVARACAEAETAFGGNGELMNYWALALARLGDQRTGLEKIDAALADDGTNPTYHRNRSLILLHLEELEDSVRAFSDGTTPYEAPAVPAEQAEKITGDYAELEPGYDDNALHIEIAERMVTFADSVLDGRRGLAVIDGACGTGLVGRRLGDMAATITGIDLSPAMISRAEASGAYDTLVTGDLVVEMGSRPATADLIIVCGALQHIADLSGVFRVASDALRHDGLFVFCVDPVTDAHDIRQVTAGEYAHSRAYLRRLADANALTETAMKIMAHRAYPGFWAAFRK